MNDKKNRIPIPGRYIGTGSAEDPLTFDVTEGGRLILRKSVHGVVPSPVDLTEFYLGYGERNGEVPWELSPAYDPETLPAGLWVIDGDDSVYEILEGGLLNGYYPAEEVGDEPERNYGLGVRILSGRLLFPATREDRLKAEAPAQEVEAASDLEAKVLDLYRRLERAKADNETLNQQLQVTREGNLNLRHAVEEMHGWFLKEREARFDVEEDLEKAEMELDCRRTGKDQVGTWIDTEGEDYWRDYWRKRSVRAEQERNSLRGFIDALRAASEVAATW